MTLDRVGITIVLNKLARKPGRARELYIRLMGCWGQRPDREKVTIKLGDQDIKELESLNLRSGILGQDVLPSGWLAVYRAPNQSRLEVTVRSKSRPPKRRTFIVGSKKRQLVRVSASRITNNKEATLATRTRKRKPAAEEEDLELEGLEDLEDLDDEDLEDEEPEDEDEDEDEDEAPAPKRGRAKKPVAKKATPAKKTTRKRAPEPEEDEDEEDEEPTPRKRPAAKGKAAASKAASKSKAKPAAKKGNNLPTTRELPSGQVGPTDIAEMVGGDCDARYVRIFLRDNYERPDGGRWAFGKQDARSIAKEIKAHRRRNG